MGITYARAELGVNGAGAGLGTIARNPALGLERKRSFKMPKTSLRQKKSIGRVMHEYAHGELKSGRSGKGGKVKSRRQAIAIALNEAGASKYKSRQQNKRNETRTEAKEARGETYQQEREGKSHLGASGKRESSRAMGGKNATRRTVAGRKAARTRAADKAGRRRSSAR
jgi:hypothetical protein